MARKKSTPDLQTIAGTEARPMGWIPPFMRTDEQHQRHEAAMAKALPRFSLQGTYHETKGRFALWMALQQVLGSKLRDKQLLPYNWQVTGSCVGAGGGNALKTLMAVEIKAGEIEEYRELWWPYTYGRSRFRAGMTTPGEGSFGSAWVEAAKEDGSLAQDEAPDLPQFQNKDGWIQIDGTTEKKWSDGDAQHVLELSPIAKLHLVGAYVPIKNSSEGKAAISNGYSLTSASMFGTKTITKKGTPAVYIAEFDDQWPHQMYYDEAWDHPTEGLIFRKGNNWGPKAHKEPTQGEPWGGMYITAKTFDRIAGGRDSEVFAISKYSGFIVRELDFFA